MKTKLRSIVVLETGGYEVTIMDGEHAVLMTCSVHDRDGVRTVSATPDLIMQLGLHPRLVAAAVLSVDDLVRET